MFLFVFLLMYNSPVLHNVYSVQRRNVSVRRGNMGNGFRHKQLFIIIFIIINVISAG